MKNLKNIFLIAVAGMILKVNVANAKDVKPAYDYDCNGRPVKGKVIGFSYNSDGTQNAVLLRMPDGRKVLVHKYEKFGTYADADKTLPEYAIGDKVKICYDKNVRKFREGFRENILER